MAVWLTPLLNPQAISARSQIARLDAGEDIAKLPVYEMTHKWGHAGTTQITNLKAKLEADGETEKLEQVVIAQEGKGRYLPSPTTLKKRGQELDKAMLVYPKGSVLPSELFTEPNYQTDEVFDNCVGKDTPPVDNCVLISVPKSDNTEAHFVLFIDINKNRQILWLFDNVAPKKDSGIRKNIILTGSAKQDLRNGVYKIARPRWSSVELEGTTLYPVPWDRSR
jgi:hypothetical protein